jgi:Spy/CpxP family protein refolding chaperone
MKRIWIIVLLLSLGLNLGLGIGLLRGDATEPAPDAPPSWRHREPREGPPGEVARRMLRGRLDHMKRELDLDQQQVDRLWELHRERADEVVGWRRDQLELRSRLNDLLLSPEATWEDVQAVIAEQTRLQARLDSTVVRIMFEERQVLTEEQRARYHEFVFPLQGEPGGRRGRFPRGGDRPRHRP